MSDSEEKKPVRSGLGWFPKLILWAVVISFGYVYLSSVDREGGGTTASSMLNSIAKLSPVPLSSLPGFSDKEESAAVSTELALADEAPKTEAPAKPTESTETPKTAEASKPAPPPPFSYAAAALKVTAEPTPAPSAPAPAEIAKPDPTPVAIAVSSPVEQPASSPVAAEPKVTAPIATFAAAPLQAQPVPGLPSPTSDPSVVTDAPAADAVSDAAEKTAQEIAEIKAMLNQVYADANSNLSPGAAEILAIGTGASLGFVASGFIMNAWIAPVASSLATTLGLSANGVGIVTGSVTTIGIISGTYAGGVYARNLVAN